MPPLVTTLSSFLNLYQVSCRHNIPLWFSSLPTFPNWFSSHFDPYHLFPFFWAGRLSIFSRRLYIPANKLNLNSDEEKKHFCVQDIWLPSECHLLKLEYFPIYKKQETHKQSLRSTIQLFFSQKPARCSWRLWFTIFNDKRSHFLWSFSAQVVLTFHFAEATDNNSWFRQHWRMKLTTK